MECKVKIKKIRDGVEVGIIDNIAHAESHPDIIDFFEGLVDSIVNAIKTTAFFTFLSKISLKLIPPASIYVLYMQAKAEAEQSMNICHEILGKSNYSCSKNQDVRLDESDEFDEIQIEYHAWSEDDIKLAKPAYVSPPAYSQGWIERTDNKYIYVVNIKISALENGKYPFVFGAVDSGWKNDVAAFSYLSLEWRKKPKPNCTSLRQLSESIDPPSSSRSLRSVAKILGVKPLSLKECCIEQARCLSVQEAPLTIFEHNAALFPEHLEEDIFGFKQLYDGSNRQAAIESYIYYLMEKKPDIVGFCEFWVPEERNQLRESLREIYPFDSVFYAEGPCGNAPGKTTIMDGGLLLLSKYPIMARDQIIYSSCAAEDCFSAKGAIYAGILVPGYPSLVNVFLTHMQSCPIKAPLLPDTGPGDGCWEKLMVFQVRELWNFIHKNANQGPCIAMGDFNLDAFYKENGVPVRYNSLTNGLHNPVDVWKEVTDHMCDVFYPGSPFWEAKIKSCEWEGGRTEGGAKGFKPNDERKWDDPERFKQTDEDKKPIGTRIDYIFGFPSSNGRYRIGFENSRVVMILYDDRKDASDHYGLFANVKSMCERKEGCYDQ